MYYNTYKRREERQVLRGGRLKVVHRGIRGGKFVEFSVHNWKGTCT